MRERIPAARPAPGRVAAILAGAALALGAAGRAEAAPRSPTAARGSPAAQEATAARPGPSPGRVEELEREVRRLRSLEARYASAERGLIGKLEAEIRTIALADRELELARTKLWRGEKDVEELGREAAGLEQRVAADRDSLRLSLLRAYERKRPDWLVLLLTAESPSALPRDLRLIERLSSRQTAAIRRFSQEETALRQTRARLEERNVELRRLRAELETRRAEAARARARTALALNDVEHRKEDAVRELRDAARQLSGLVGGLGHVVPPPPTGFEGQRGRLPWPVDGLVSKRFGDERHPRFNTLVEHPGVDLSTPAGSPVRAVHAGTVAYADAFKGYGLLVVLDHGDSFYTLYARLGDLSIARGARVDAGSVLGRAGAPGVLGEPGLYFEVRQGEKALDPEAWLQRPARR